jgi:DNA-binding MarR family transcriptional regulator
MGMTDRAVAEVETGKAFYQNLLPDLNVGHFGAMWHSLVIAHLAKGNLETIARAHGLGISDLFVLGTLRIDRGQPHHATDLADSLFLTNGAISGRIAHLAQRGLLNRAPDPDDHRATQLSLTAAGMDIVKGAIQDIAAHSQFAKAFYRLPAEDQQRLGEILGRLHIDLHRSYPGG